MVPEYGMLLVFSKQIEEFRTPDGFEFLVAEVEAEVQCQFSGYRLEITSGFLGRSKFLDDRRLLAHKQQPLGGQRLTVANSVFPGSFSSNSTSVW